MKGKSDQGQAARVSRRQARRDALFILYQLEISTSSLDELFAGIRSEAGHEPDEFTRDEVAGVVAARKALDGAIDAASTDWPARRLGPLEKNILRIAVYEILNRADIPPEVSINEAVALAKRFCSSEAGSLTNGILGRIIRGAGKNE